MSDILEHGVHIKTSTVHPYGRMAEVTLDGQKFICQGASVDFSATDFHTVTLTFVAHVTVEEDE